MDDLPADQKLRRKDAYYSLILAPIEYVTSSLRKGDPWRTEDLADFVQRCRALVAAYDARVARAKESNQ